MSSNIFTEQQATSKLAKSGVKVDGGEVSLKGAESIVSGTFALPDANANAIGTGTVISGITVKADDDNTGDVYVGKSGVAVGNGMRLGAGESVPISVNDISKVFVIGTTGDKVHYIGG